MTCTKCDETGGACTCVPTLAVRVVDTVTTAERPAAAVALSTQKIAPTGQEPHRIAEGAMVGTYPTVQIAGGSERQRAVIVTAPAFPVLVSTTPTIDPWGASYFVVPPGAPVTIAARVPLYATAASWAIPPDSGPASVSVAVLMAEA